MKYLNLNSPVYLEHFVPNLLTAWEAEGYYIGVDQHLQIRRLLEQLDEATPIEKLKTLLAPLLTDNPRSQSEFYALFDDCLEKFWQQFQAHEEVVHKEHLKLFGKQTANKLAKKFQQTKLYTLGDQWNKSSVVPSFVKKIINVGLLLSLLILGYFGVKSFQNSAAAEPEKLEIAKILYHVDLNQGGPSTLHLVYPPNIITDPNNGLKRAINSNLHFSLITSPNPQILQFSYFTLPSEIKIQLEGLKKGRELIEYKACDKMTGKCFLISIVIKSDFYEGSPPQGSISAEQLRIANYFNNNPTTKDSLNEDFNVLRFDDFKLDSSTALLDTTFLKFDPTSEIIGETATIQVGGGLAYMNTRKGLFLGGCALAMLLIGLWFKRARQQFLLEHQPSHNSPHTWMIRIPYLRGVNFGRVFSQTLTAMRQRIEGSWLELDLKNTVKSSLKNGGAITLNYNKVTESKRYLALIDIASQENHQAQLLKLFIETLAANDAPIECFFYNKDIRTIWNYKYKKGIPLNKLEHDYRDANLIIFGSGDIFYDKTSGTLADWTSTFEAWNKRVLLTIKSTKEWTEQEEALNGLFPLLPATPDGLSKLVDTLEEVDPKDYRLMMNQGQRAREKKNAPIILDAEEQKSGTALIQRLEREFITEKYGETDDSLLKWIATCALSPVLFWHWTLYIGQLLSEPGHNKVTIDYLFQINRLPWFIEGKMPDYARNVLLKWLEEHHPNWLFSMRKEWNEILDLKENIPPVDSLAWDKYRVQYILSELLLKPGKKRREELESELEQLLYGRQQEDTMVIKYLEERNDQITPWLSNRFRTLLQKKHGLFWRWRDWTWQTPAFLLIALVTLITHFNVPVTTFQFKDHITSLGFSADDQNIYVGSGYSDLSVCSVDGAFQQGIKGEKDNLIKLATDEAGTMILTGSSGNDYVYWDIAGAPLFALDGPANSVTDIAFQANNPFKVIFGLYKEGKAEVWDLQKGHLHSLQHNDAVNTVSFSKDGAFILTGSSDGLVKLWSKDGTELKTFKGDKGKVHSANISPDNQYILVGYKDNTAILWDFSGQQIHKFSNHSYDVTTTLFSPDGKSLLTIADNDVTLWSVETGQQIRRFIGHYRPVKAAAFSGDGKYLVTGAVNGVVKVWHL